MEAVEQFAAQAVAQARGGSMSTPAHEQPKRVLSQLWVSKLQSRMTAIYGHRFSSLFPGEQAAADWRDTWARALGDMTGEEIARGLEVCARDCEWPPSVAEFRAMCRLRPRVDPTVHAMLSAPRDTKDRTAEMAAIWAMLARRVAHAA